MCIEESFDTTFSMGYGGGVDLYGTKIMPVLIGPKAGTVYMATLIHKKPRSPCSIISTLMVGSASST